MFANSFNRGFRGSLTTLLVLYILVFSITFFIQKSEGFTYFPNIFYNYLAAKISSPFTILLFNHFLLIGGISLVALIVSNEEITEKLNYFPVLIFFVINIVSLNKDRVSLHLFGNIVILYSLFQLFNTYRKENVLSQIFNACFFLSIALYLNIANILLFPFIFISLAILRPFNWREFAMALIGFATPIFIYECISYLLNFNQWYIFESLAEMMSTLTFPVMNMNLLPLMIFIAILFVISIVSFLAEGLGNTVKKQKAKVCFFWFMIFFVPLFFISGSSYENILTVYSIPLAFLIGDMLFGLRSGKLVNILLFILILSTLFYLAKRTTFI